MPPLPTAKKLPIEGASPTKLMLSTIPHSKDFEPAEIGELLELLSSN